MIVITKVYAIKDVKEDMYLTYGHPYKSNEYTNKIHKSRIYDTYEEAIEHAEYIELEYFVVEHFYYSTED